MGLWVTTRLFPPGIRGIVGTFLFENVTYVNIEGLDPKFLNGFIFLMPNAAFYEGQRYELDQRHISQPGTMPTVFPTDPRKVTYEHYMYASLGLDSVVFKGQSIHLHRGNGEDDLGFSGPNVISNRGVDECILALPTVSNWLLKGPFTLCELLDGLWSLHFLKSGGGYHFTESRVGRSYKHDGILHVEINWIYGS